MGGVGAGIDGGTRAFSGWKEEAIGETEAKGLIILVGLNSGEIRFGRK